MKKTLFGKNIEDAINCAEGPLKNTLQCMNEQLLAGDPDEDSIEYGKSGNIVIVDYSDPYESFGWRGSIHIEIDLNNKTITTAGWRNGRDPLPKEEEQRYLEFFSNTSNLNDFFDNRKAYSTPIDERFEHAKWYELKIQWKGRIKAITVGNPDIPFKHPFGMY